MNIHRVGSPEDESETSNGGEQGSDLATLCGSLLATVKSQVPDDNEVGNAGNGVVSPLARVLLATESGKETSQNHDEIGNNGKEDVCAVHASKERKIEEKHRGGNRPVNVTSPVDLTVDVLSGVGNVLVLLSDGGVVVRDTVTNCHGEIGDGGSHHDDGGNNMVKTLALLLKLDPNPV